MGPKPDGTGVLMRRDSRELSACASRGEPMEDQKVVLCRPERKLPAESDPGSLISGLQPSEPRGKRCLLFKPRSVVFCDGGLSRLVWNPF